MNTNVLLIWLMKVLKTISGFSTVTNFFKREEALVSGQGILFLTSRINASKVGLTY